MIRKIVLLLAVYAIAMALLESATVVYLRELYYPGGFFIQSASDLKVISKNILIIEIWREVATIMMLGAVSSLAFAGYKNRLAAFLWIFSIWDLFYYFFLYVFLGWPSSFGTLDVYFLIPWPWIGPVWLPLVIFSVLAAGSLWYLLAAPRNLKNL